MFLKVGSSLCLQRLHTKIPSRGRFNDLRGFKFRRPDFPLRHVALIVCPEYTVSALEEKCARCVTAVGRLTCFAAALVRPRLIGARPRMVRFLRSAGVSGYYHSNGAERPAR